MNENKPTEKLFNDLEKLMIYLYERWFDEHEFENISDYSTPIIPKVEEIGGKFLQMYKKPFGFSYQYDGKVYRIKVTDTIYSYEKIK